MQAREDGCNQSDRAMNGSTVFAWFVPTLVFPASKKRGICWLRWFIFARGDLIKAFLMQCVINGQCRLQRESDSRVKLWLLSNKKLNCFLIALLSHFYVGILGIIPALQVRAFLRQQVAQTHKKKISCPHLKVIYTQFLYLMECPGSIFSVILTSHSWKPSI